MTLLPWGVIKISFATGSLGDEFCYGVSLISPLSVGSHREQLCHGESFGAALSMGSH